MDRLLALLALLALLLAGCTGAPGDDFVTPDQDEAGRYVIKMTTGFRFIPDEAEVPVGATVVWVNEGGSHNAVAEDGEFVVPASGLSQGMGEVGEHTFDAAGTFEYVCQPHESQGMMGTIRVVEA